MGRENQIGYNGADRRDSGAVIFVAPDVVTLPPRQQTLSGKTLCVLPTGQETVHLTGRVADILYTLEGSSRYHPVAGTTIASALGVPADSISSAVRRAANHRSLARTNVAIGLPEGKKTGYYLRDTSMPEFPLEKALEETGIIPSHADILSEVATFLSLLAIGERLKAKDFLEYLRVDGSQESGLRKVRRLKDAAVRVLTPEWEIKSYGGGQGKNAGYELVKREEKIKGEILFNG